MPNFFIIGTPKAGTTALQKILSAHPDVFMSPIKEPHYFSTDFDKKKFAKKLLHKYRLVILNEDTFEERFAIKLTRLNVFVLISISDIFSLL